MMRKMTDIHVHSSFSHDGKSTISDYAALLRVNSGIEAIGLAEHVDFMPECGGYGTFDNCGYLSEAIKKQYRDVMIIPGAEIDYSTTVENEIKTALRQNDYAYVIASVHIVNKIPFSTDENKSRFTYSDEFRHILEEYYHQVGSCLNMKETDCVGHIGIYKRYMEKSLLDEMDLTEYISMKENSLAKACAESGKIIEVNTSGYKSAAKAPFPDYDFMRKFYSYGGRKAALGSDAHKTDDVCFMFAEAAARLREIGFKDLVKPWENR